MLTFGLMKFRGQDILRTVLVFIAVLSLCLQSNCAVPKPDEGTQCNDSFCPLDPTESSRFCRFSEIYPRNYIAYKTKNPPIIDGVLNDEAWEQVEWSDLFVDILGNSAQTPRFETRMKMRWDSNFLYIAAALQEPDIWANLTQHNSVIFHDNDFEVFVDPAGSTHFYKEFEINANNATWDLCLNRPYLNGGYENSSRTFPAAGWDMPAARSAVHVDGEINRPGPPGRQWTVELALPVADLVYNNTARRPKPGWLWRINFSRVEWHVVYTGDHYEKVPGAAEDNWVWAPTGAVNMHLPERWGYLQFAGPAVNASRPRRDPFWTLRVVAFGIYDAQIAYMGQAGRYTDRLEDLVPLAPPHLLDGSCTRLPEITLGPAGSSYVATVRTKPGTKWATIGWDRLILVGEDTAPPASPGGSGTPAAAPNDEPGGDGTVAQRTAH